MEFYENTIEKLFFILKFDGLGKIDSIDYVESRVLPLLGNNNDVYRFSRK